MKWALIALMMIGLVACKDDTGQASSATGIDRVVIETPDGERAFSVELAITPQQMQKGLMHREHMDADAGMLFYFGGEAERGFFMRNTLIPLDMLFIRKDGTIHSIHENAVPLDDTTIFSQGPVSAVLEINGGLSQKLGLKPGQVARHTFFGNALAQSR